MRPLVLVGAVCLLVGSAGCGARTVSAADDDGAATARMREVAEAWEGSESARSWREGFYPLEDVVRLPDNAFRTDADKQAYLTRNFEHRGALPRTEHEGRIRWADGTSTPVTPMTAREAYDGLDEGPEGRADPLTVTKATFGEMTLLTSRGEARVPAWHFTLDGYDTPLVRAAISPARLPGAPIAALSQATDPGMPLHGLRKVAEDGRSVTVQAEHGACDDGPAVDVLETRDSVVLRGTVRGADDGPCTAQLLVDPVTVRLDRPLGGRILLDAFTGGPVELGGR
ncbi:hypothetical protein PV341_39765 [Streptomyces sp. PA03-1a]|nr:hypothetical protein [Streptomyces sp. PA03-1a]MDX2812768.1 hypothetical protein [Streptomyces sp. PA03-5A]